MRGYPHLVGIREKCRDLRERGYSLNEIVALIKIPKTTVHDWVSHQIILSQKAKKRIQRQISKGSIKGNRSLKRSSIKIIPQPNNWTSELISIVAHFLFDGYPTWKNDGYVYCSRNLSQIYRLNKLMRKIFNLTPSLRITEDKIIRSTFYSVKLSKYFDKKKKELLGYLPKATSEEKLAFLKAFFDDEGGISYEKARGNREVRGFQYSKKILKLVQNLLKDFGIKSHIGKRNTEVIITSKDNIIKFRDKINFSPGIYINPDRKNGLWKYKIDKRTILERAINSYQI